MLKRAVATVALLLGTVIPANALDYDHRVISWQDSSPLHESPLIYGTNGSPCTNGWSGGCEPKNERVDVINFLPNCDQPAGSDSKVDCIDSIFAEVNGKNIKGERVANQNGIDDRYSYVARPEYGIAKASSYEIYRFAGLSHDKGNLFMVYPWNSKTIIKGVIEDNQYTFLIAPAHQDAMYDCARLHTANDLCWLTGSFKADTRFTLNVIFSKAPAGWFSGRITDPSIKMATSKDNRISVAFTGISQSVPSITRNFKSNVTSEFNEWNLIAKAIPYLAWNGKHISSGIPFTSDEITVYENIVSTVPSFNNADELKNVWRIDSKPAVNWSSTKSDCIKSGLTGVVSSNSMTYANSIPSWDASSGSLVYSMASPHTALGKEFVGRYDLLISEQVGKCLWSLKSLTPSAEINVTGANGQKKVVTASSKIVDGFYKFTVAGFTFSSNKVSVKMVSDGSNPIQSSGEATAPVVNQEPIAAPTPASSKPAAQMTAKKQTITCVKGKIQKKLTSVNPKCPAGYKKK
jgi:hypothetical protein